MVAGPGLRLALVAVALAWTGAAAQDASLEATIDRQVVRANESFTYSLRAEGQVRGDPDASPLEQQFDVLSRSTNSRIQIVNGRTEQVVEWVFQLMPREPGRFTLPPLEVGTLASNAIELEVLPAEPSDGAVADIFMEVEAEPLKAYVQSQVLFTLRLYRSVSTGRATLAAPKVTGGEAIVESLGEDRQYQTERDGRTFIVSERRYAVFPQQSGGLTIGPATFEAMVIPARGFSRVRRLQSDAVQIEVEPAVQPPPEYPRAGWLPATRLTLADRLSDEGGPFTLGVPRTRTLTIRADGVLETQLPGLELEQTTGIRQYPDQPELDRITTELGLSVERTQRYAVIAQQDGRIELGGAELPWFDTVNERWQVARIEPRTVDVLRGAEPAGVPPAPAEDSPAEPASAEPAADGFWRIVSAVLAAGWLLTLALWSRRALRAALERRRSAPAQRAGGGSRRRLLKRAREASRASDPAATQQLLLEWAALRFPDAPPATLGALAPLLPEALAERVRELEAHLYGRRADRWRGAALADALAEVESRPRRRGARAADDPLEPLYR